MTIDIPLIVSTSGNLTLYPANHNYVTFTIADFVTSVSDACDDSVDLSGVVIAQVLSDEPEDAKGNGDGATKNDIVIAGDCKSVQLRVERADQLDGRVYIVVLKAKDSTGNILQAARKIFVPVSRKAQAVDSGTAGYSVNGLYSLGTTPLSSIEYRPAEVRSIKLTTPILPQKFCDTPRPSPPLLNRTSFNDINGSPG